MLKNYLAVKNISIYSISKSSGISYSTLNDLVNGKAEVANVKAGILYALAKALGISMNQLYELCQNDIVVRSERYNTKGFVSRKNKKYYLNFEYHQEKHECELCSIKKEASMFIDSIALWALESRLSEIEMEEAYALCIKAKG